MEDDQYPDKFWQKLTKEFWAKLPMKERQSYLKTASTYGGGPSIPDEITSIGVINTKTPPTN